MPLVAPDQEISWETAEALRESGIETSLHDPAIPGFSGYVSLATDGVPPLSNEYCARTLTLPLYPSLDAA